MKKLILFLAASAIFSANAQEIKKEITIEKEIVPELRAASRLNVEPNVVSPEINHKKLILSDRDLTVGIPPYLTLLSAARTNPAVTVSPYKGYVKASYFPAYNLGVSAGYRIANDSANCANIYAQFNGIGYGRDIDPTRDIDVSDNTGMIAADFRHHFNRHQYISLDAEILFSSVSLKNKAEGISDPKLKNSAFGVNFNALWHSGTSEENYYAGLSANYFSNDPSETDLSVFGIEKINSENYGGISQGLYRLNFGIGYHGFSIDATAGINRFNHRNEFLYDSDMTGALYYGDSKNAFTVTAIPAYTYNKENLKARFGVRFDYTSALGKNFVVAPDVELGIAPADFFSASLNVTGGSETNFAGTLFQWNHFMAPVVAYKASNIPVKGELKLTVGPFKGARLEVEAGYAIANDWLMPYITDGKASIFNYVDMKGWKGGAHLFYDYKDIVSARAGITVSPQNHEKGWFEWRDRAKQVIDIDVTVRPISKLRVNAGWELRQGRAESYLLNGEPELVKLGDLSNLHVGAAYNFTEQFNVFANVTNLLNKKSELIYGVPAIGISGGIGVSYLF